MLTVINKLVPAFNDLLSSYLGVLFNNQGNDNGHSGKNYQVQKALKTQSNLTTKLPTAQLNEGELVLLDF